METIKIQHFISENYMILSYVTAMGQNPQNSAATYQHIKWVCLFHNYICESLLKTLFYGQATVHVTHTQRQCEGSLAS
jgi:hypothetical protein